MQYKLTGKTLEGMLRQASSDFANSPKHLRIAHNRLRVSSLMQWYAEDFQLMGGPGSYLSRLVDPARRPDDGTQLKKLLLTDYSRAEFHFNWTVNSMTGLP
jgi:hypothetical protein